MRDFKRGINIMRKLFIVLAMFTALNAGAQWQRLNFAEGGGVQAITMDSSGFIYVASNNSRQIFRSANKGSTWKFFTNDFPYLLISDFISTKSAIYAGTYGGGVYKSTNHGLNWVQCNNGLSNNYVFSFTLNNNYIFAGAQNGVYRSSNEGLQWEYVNSGIGFTHGANAMTVQDSVVFAATAIGSTGYMYRTTNNGLNWTLVNSGLPLFLMTSLTKCGNKVFSIGGTNNLFETSDYGDNWLSISIPPNLNVESFASCGDSLLVSVSANHGKLYITTNGGENWVIKETDLPEIYNSRMMILKNRVIGTGSYGIYSSSNFGSNWLTNNRGFTDVEILTITARNNIVIAGTKYHGVYRSTNYGIGWNRVQSIDSHSTITKFIWQGNSMYTNYGHKIIRSTDYGLTFFKQGDSLPFFANLTSFAMKGDIIIGPSSSNGIYRSTQAGYNWALCSNGLPSYVYSVPFVFFKDTICFAYVEELPVEGRLYYSLNYGQSWDSVSNSGIYVRPVSVSYNSTFNKLYLSILGGIFTSTNSGFNWISSNTGLPANPNVTSFFMNGDTIYTSLKGSGIYKSTVQSSVWTSFNDGLKNLYVNSIYGDKNYLYAGVNSNGVYRRRTNILTSLNNTNEISYRYSLFQNYPNPFNPRTNIRFAVAKLSDVKIVIYDLSGKEVEVLVNEQLQAGTYLTDWNASNYSSGVYFYKIQAGDFSETKRMLMIK